MVQAVPMTSESSFSRPDFLASQLSRTGFCQQATLIHTRYEKGAILFLRKASGSLSAGGKDMAVMLAMAMKRGRRLSRGCSKFK